MHSTDDLSPRATRWTVTVIVFVWAAGIIGIGGWLAIRALGVW